MTYKFTSALTDVLNEKLDDALSLQVQKLNLANQHLFSILSGRFNIATPEADYSFAFEERDMSGRSLFVFSGSPADTDQEAIELGKTC